MLTDLTSGQVLDTVPSRSPYSQTQTVDLTWDSTGATLGKHNLQVEAVVPDDIDPGDNTRTDEVDVKVPKHDIALGRHSTAPGSIGQGGQLVLIDSMWRTRETGPRRSTWCSPTRPTALSSTAGR